MDAKMLVIVNRAGKFMGESYKVGSESRARWVTEYPDARQFWNYGSACVLANLFSATVVEDYGFESERVVADYTGFC